MSKEVKARISGIEPQDYTLVWELQSGTSPRSLHQVEARTKLLITLSDGTTGRPRWLSWSLWYRRYSSRT